MTSRICRLFRLGLSQLLVYCGEGGPVVGTSVWLACYVSRCHCLNASFDMGVRSSQHVHGWEMLPSGSLITYVQVSLPFS